MKFIAHKCHCERSEAISGIRAIADRDCFGVRRTPRNDESAY
jgi:hypothetical protein